MKVSINFGEEIQLCIQQHLDDGKSVQQYIRAAVLYFNKMISVEREGKKCGYGDKLRFSSYNTECSPDDYLNSSAVN